MLLSVFTLKYLYFEYFKSIVDFKTELPRLRGTGYSTRTVVRDGNETS